MTPRSNLAFLFVLFFFLPATSWARVDFSSSAYEKKSFVIFSVGDIIPHIPIKQSAKILKGYDSFFSYIKPVLQTGDLNFANLETTILEPQQVRPFPGCWPGYFWAQPHLLKSIRKAGFNVVSIANNHTLDFRNSGFRQTLEHIKMHQLIPIGYQMSPVKKPVATVHIKGIKVGILAYTSLLNVIHPYERKYPQVNYLQNLEYIKAMLKQIQWARKNHDLVIVSIHWGYEYAAKENHYNSWLAKQMHKAGVDIILGHHAHVLQKVYRLRSKNGHETLVIPSMGNYLANQGKKLDDLGDYKTRLSALFRIQVTFARHESFPGLNEKKIEWAYYPLWIRNTWMLMGKQVEKISLIKPSFLQCELDEAQKETKKILARIDSGESITISHWYYLLQKLKKINLGYAMARQILGNRMLKMDCENMN